MAVIKEKTVKDVEMLVRFQEDLKTYRVEFRPNTSPAIILAHVASVFCKDETLHVGTDPQSARLAKAEELMREFCARVESGEVRSKKTYAAFQEFLAESLG